MAITIKNASKEFTTVEKYLMTTAPTVKVVKDIPDDTTLNVTGYLEYDDIKEDGSVNEIMSLITTDNEVYSTQSKTFKRSIKDIESVMGQFPLPIKKISGVTKAGRPFVNAVLDINALK